MRSFVGGTGLAVLLVFSFSVAIVHAAGARFHLLAPAEEVFLKSGKVLLIAKVEGYHEAKMAEIFDNGKTIGFVPINRNVLVDDLKLVDGRHELTLAAPGIERLKLKIFIGKQEGYRYHIETDTSACDTCHPGGGKGVYSIAREDEALCGDCHDPVNNGKFVHGPVAAGSCTPCHDPHGSRNKYFLRATGKELCLGCHSQDLSRNHIEKRRNAVCTKCHDPHSSDKKYHLL